MANNNNVAKRPLFRRLANRECVNFASSAGGKRSNDNNNQNVFTGELALNNPLGTFWPDLVQAGVLNITPGSDAEIGGFDRVKVTADGSAINLDAGYTWLPQWGAIDTTPGARNIITCRMVSATEIEYSVLN